MRRLTRALCGGTPVLALALALSGCDADPVGRPEYGAHTPTAFVTLGPFQAPPPPPPSSPPPTSPPASGVPPTAPSEAPTAHSSATASPSPTGSWPGSGDLRPTRLGPGGHAERMYAALEAAEVNGLPEAREALTARPAEGEVGLAFVLGGCRETSARLQIEDRTVSASSTGGGGWNCDQAEYFLAVFTVEEQSLPDGWTFPEPRG